MTADRDHRALARWPRSDPRLEPWRAFLQAHARISRRLDEELRAEHDLSLAEYDALLTIAEAPERRIRMRQLADARDASARAASPGSIDRLVADGLVERERLPDPTPAAPRPSSPRPGWTACARASRTHLRGIGEHFIDVLDADAAAGHRARDASLSDRPARVATTTGARPWPRRSARRRRRDADD